MSALRCVHHNIFFNIFFCSLFLFLLIFPANAFSEEIVPLKVILNGTIPDLTFSINEKEVSLEVHAATHLFKAQTIDISYTKPYDVSYPRPASAFLNYGVLYNSELTSWNISTEVGFRFRDYLGISTFNYRKDEFEEKAVRLLTSVRTDDRKNLRTLIAGDFPAISGVLGSAPLLGGVTFSKNYQIEPYYIRFPSLSMSGAVESPSEAEIYVNDMVVKRKMLYPGEFLLDNIPAEVGLGRAKIVIRDLYGVERVITEPFFYSERLLKRGLQEYSYSIGFLREDLGTKSFSYGDPMFLSFHNYGFSESIKAGYAMELSEDVIHIGPTASVLLSKTGVLDLAFAVSRSHGETGFGGFVGHFFRSKYVDTALSLTSLTEDFSNLTVEPSEDKPSFQFTGAIGFRFKDLGSISTRYSKTKLHVGPDTSRLALSYNRVLTKRATLFVTASWSEVEGFGTKEEVFFGLHVYFGKDISGLFSYTSREGADVQKATVTKSLPVGTGFGFRADVERRDGQTDVLGDIAYQNDYGIYGMGYREVGEREFYKASVSGGVGYVDGSVFLSRPLIDSFAKVKVGEVEGVRIYYYGNEVTRTNSKGEAIIPVLRSFIDNKIDIENEDIPIDYSISTLTKYINPPFRSGPLVIFDVVKIQGFVGNIYVLVDEERVPAEFTVMGVQLKDRTVEGMVGRNGEFYLENVPPGTYPAKILYNRKECIFDIIVPETEEILVNLGEVVCEIME